MLFDLGLGFLSSADQIGGKLRADRRRQPRHQRLRKGLLLIQRRSHAESELGIVLKERVRPRGSAALRIEGVRCCRQVAAVDRRAARRIGDVEPVAEQLREQLDVRRLAAARAGAGELEERLQELQVLHL